VISFDRDAESMQWAKQRLDNEGLLERVALLHSDFRFAPHALEQLQQVVREMSGVERARSESTQCAEQANLENQEDDSSESEGEETHAAAPRVFFVGREFIGRAGEVFAGHIAGTLVDAGMSMFQVAWGERGLSFQHDAELDMRYDRRHGLSAFDLVNRLSSQELEDLFFKFTDERWARRIAAIITEHRRRQVIHTTSELTSLIEAAIPAGVRRHMRVHPATRVFAALRLAVNDEFWALEEGTWALSAVLANAARFVVLTYSSHEDRTVKRTFRRLAAISVPSGTEYSRQEAATLSMSSHTSSTRSPLTFSIEREAWSLELPTERDSLEAPAFLASSLSDFGQSWGMRIVTGKPIVPSIEEVERNPLSRSCKLRAVEKFEKT
jgi:16S rRNA (cytosine(1402)-N(4))-methyltransferase